MKHWLIAFFAVLLLLPCIGLAETAQDITEACLMNDREFNRFAPDDLRDHDYTSFYTGSALTITAPEGAGGSPVRVPSSGENRHPSQTGFPGRTGAAANSPWVMAR